MNLVDLFQSMMGFFDIAIQSEFVFNAIALFSLCVVLRCFWLLCVQGGRRDV